jgi:hypothetical protein
MRHPTSLALLLLTSAALHSSSALAGGIGLLGTAGFHQARVYYYDAEDNQVLNRQNCLNSGVGIEAILGDKDDRFLGVARGYYLVDSPPTDPPAPTVDDPVDALPEGPTRIGMATVGVHWGVIGDPTGFQAHIGTHVGAGMVTVDSTTGEGSSQEFLLGEVALGAHYHFARSFQVYADVAYGTRYRKEFSPGGNAYVGFRYMFD